MPYIQSERPPANSQDEFQIDLIQKALELGYTHFDTAEIYGASYAEELDNLNKIEKKTWLGKNSANLKTQFRK